MFNWPRKKLVECGFYPIKVFLPNSLDEGCYHVQQVTVNVYLKLCEKFVSSIK